MTVGYGDSAPHVAIQREVARCAASSAPAG
jgi:hypothetical protein